MSSLKQAIELYEAKRGQQQITPLRTMLQVLEPSLSQPHTKQSACSTDFESLHQLAQQIHHGRKPAPLPTKTAAAESK